MKTDVEDGKRDMGLIVGAVAGAVAGWILAAVTSSGPRTPLEAMRGGYTRRGVGCVGFILIVAGGAIIGAIIGSLVGGT